jgi:nicotinate phosphoribosyltransferase
MMQFIWFYFPKVFAVFNFTNRTKKIKLAEYIPIDVLKSQLDKLTKTRFTEKELKYLGSLKGKKRILFRPEFIDYLRTWKFKPNSYTLSEKDGQFELKFHGKWIDVTLFETFTLSIVNELFAHYYQIEHGIDVEELKKEGWRRFWDKLSILFKYPLLIFINFGTRRRYSGKWQLEIDKILKQQGNKIGFLGTSSVYSAMLNGLTPIGTMAHEIFMGGVRLFGNADIDIKNAHNKIIQLWEEFYVEELLIALTDTYGTKFFFKDLTKDQIKIWTGLRQDSGKPLDFLHNAAKFYKQHEGYIPTKVLVFSDGLDVDTMIEIYEANKVYGFILIFGWGTNLTNDLGIPSISIVIKLLQIGYSMEELFDCVKLSDNVEKATGNPEEIQRFIKIFEYENKFSEECKY